MALEQGWFRSSSPAQMEGPSGDVDGRSGTPIQVRSMSPLHSATHFRRRRSTGPLQRGVLEGGGSGHRSQSGAAHRLSSLAEAVPGRETPLYPRSSLPYETDEATGTPPELHVSVGSVDSPSTHCPPDQILGSETVESPVAITCDMGDMHHGTPEFIATALPLSPEPAAIPDEAPPVYLSVSNTRTSDDVTEGGSRPPSLISTLDKESNGRISRLDPDDGIYIDRAPNMELLNERQKEIAEEYPDDLDSPVRGLLGDIWHIILDWRKYVRMCCQWRYTHYYIILALVIALIAWISIMHDQLINWLEPISHKVRSVPWGWIIPVILLFICSFPPLFGGEIVSVLCGIVYGVWIGFGIVAFGTLLGEMGNFYAFRYLLKRAARKAERTSLFYLCMARIIVTGGCKIALVFRLSAIPGHLTTALFATVGMGFWVYFLAALLSLPKHLSVVYLGVVMRGEHKSPGEKATQAGVMTAVALVTVAIALYIWWKLDRVKPVLQKELRQERFDRLRAASTSSTSSSPSLSGAEKSAKYAAASLSPSLSTADKSTDRLARSTEDIPELVLSDDQASTSTGSGAERKRPLLNSLRRMLPARLAAHFSVS